MVGSDGGGDDVVSNVFVVGWLSEFVFRACNGQFAWRSWFCTDTLEVCLMTVSKSDGAVCGRWYRKRDSQGTTKKPTRFVSSVSSGVRGVSI